MLERSRQVTARRRQISTVETRSWEVSWVSREHSSSLVSEMAGKRAKNRAKLEPWPTIGVESLLGSAENLDLLLGCQGYIQRQGRAICVSEGSVVPASGQTADRDVRGSYQMFCERKEEGQMLKRKPSLVIRVKTMERVEHHQV